MSGFPGEGFTFTLPSGIMARLFCQKFDSQLAGILIVRRHCVLSLREAEARAGSGAKLLGHKRALQPLGELSVPAAI
jgi:hypothetical protein